MPHKVLLTIAAKYPDLPKMQLYKEIADALPGSSVRSVQMWYAKEGLKSQRRPDENAMQLLALKFGLEDLKLSGLARGQG